jgi:hypothetical protein
MRSGFALVISAALAALWHAAAPAEAQAGGQERIQLAVDASEAEAVLAALDAKKAGADDDFRTFVLSEDLARRAPALRRTLDAWVREDLVAAARRALPYLPEEAFIRARVYLVIKPLSNSFVFDVSTDAAIFLYLDPEVTAAKFAKT